MVYSERKGKSILRALQNMTTEGIPEQKYIRGKEIGEGVQGTVYQGQKRDGSGLVAIKTIPVFKEGSNIDVSTELSHLQQNYSKNITQCLDSYLIDDSVLWIVMEYVDGVTLQDLIWDKELTPQQAATVCQGILFALDSLHKGKGKYTVVHSDVKLDNILISKDGEIKLADLGMCAKEIMGKVRHFNGAEIYRAPEKLCGKAHNRSVDIWALGIMCFEMLSGSHPYFRMTGEEILEDIDDYGPPSLDDEYPQEVQDFIAACVALDPNERPSAEQLLEHKFLAKVASADEIAKLVTSFKSKEHARSEQ